jgi:hypothetical protein
MELIIGYHLRLPILNEEFMNKEILEKRLAEIEKAIAKEHAVANQAMANINMLDGGKHECLYWLKQLEQANTPALTIDELKKMTGANSVELVEKAGNV